MIGGESMYSLSLFPAQLNQDLKTFMNQFVGQLQPTSTMPTQAQKLNAAATQRVAKVLPLFLDTCVQVGQMQLLRKQVAICLNVITRSHSSHCRKRKYHCLPIVCSSLAS